MDEEKIVKNIRSLSSYIYDNFIQTDEQRYGFLKSNFSAYLRQLEVIFEKWFPKSKPIKDEEIIKRIFVENINPKDAKIWVKYSLSCLINVSKMVFENVEYYKAKNDPDYINELEVLCQISFEAAIFLQTAFNITEKKKVEFGHIKRFHITPLETFYASQQILRKQNSRNSIGTFVLGPSSIFLIRQSIELWLQSLFGINYVLNDKNILVKLQPEILFTLIDENVNLPVEKSVIEKIHKWTQIYVHSEIMTYTWEIIHAQKIISKIYYLHEITIKEEYYNSMENCIRKLLKNDKIKLIRSKVEVKLI